MDSSTSRKYLAHISEDKREETVKEHLMAVAELAASFAKSFGAEEQGRLAGLAHDIGKYSDAFQRRLHGARFQVDHSTAGAVECINVGQPFAAFSVAGHHGGLPDGGSSMDTSDDPTLTGRLRRQLESYAPWQGELNLPEATIPGYLKQPDAIFCQQFFTRMLFSCLVDADFLATEAFMSGKSRERVDYDMADLEQRLLAHVQEWFPPKGKLNELRCEILTNCMERGNDCKPGLFTLTVPTVGGKTVSSLAFALAHARNHGFKRIIYVIPYTSIIEQNAKVFRDILGDDVVLEHHSGMLYDLEDEARPETIRMAQATENWDRPVVVTTAVQFFESLFSNRTSVCRKLHSIAESVVIFDEAQMLPIPYLRPCVAAIAELVKHYHVSAVLCTATQPSLDQEFQVFMPGVEAQEICPHDIMASPVFKRVTFEKLGKLSWEELGARLNSHEQVLCVVNSRKNAQELFRRLRGEGSYHLSTLMCPAHREEILKEIRRRLQEGKTCRVVSTSLIEAGVDVDFPTVYREEAGLDSVLQAAGRCNREGQRDAASSRVVVFQAETAPPKLFSIPIAAGRIAMGKYDDLASQEAVTEYFRELLDLKGKQGVDTKSILDLFKHSSLPFKQVSELFRLIDTCTRTVYIPWEDGKALIGELRQGRYDRTLFRKLGRYGVAVYEQQFQALMHAGVLDVLEDGSAILQNMSCYTAEVGLMSEEDSGNGLFH